MLRFDYYTTDSRCAPAKSSDPLGSGMVCTDSLDTEFDPDSNSIGMLDLAFYNRSQLFSHKPTLSSCLAANLPVLACGNAPLVFNDEEGHPMVAIKVSGLALTSKQKLAAIGKDLISRLVRLTVERAANLDECLQKK